MKNEQYEMLMIYAGMVREGTSSEGAIAYIMLMDSYEPAHIADLIKTVGASKKSELYKNARLSTTTKRRMAKAARFQS
jgi:predicted Zn-ribbon and HTH transcriptional regulator|tara:strand:+ start:585 stop:818 length:234 start_codon:yes stop_codon:yes gene_type:complete